MRAGIRYAPRPSVTLSKLFPVASSTAWIETPGNTAPVESVTVPLSDASCARPTAGTPRIVQTKINDLTRRDFIRTSSDHGFLDGEIRRRKRSAARKKSKNDDNFMSARILGPA